MADDTTKVVKYLRRKSSDGFSEPITYLGAEQRFVGALRNSGVNNLEEQYIIGTDTYTVTYLNDEGNEIVEKSFCVDGSNRNYYKLVTETLKEALNNDFFFDENQIKLPDNKEQVSFDEGEILCCVGKEIFSEENNVLKILPPSFSRDKRESLFYINENGEDILVLEKNIEKKYIVENGKNKEVIKEKITNYLTTISTKD